MLYLISTPIGNLQDITERALTSLRECDLVLCEDTRRSSILLNHFSINKPLLSYHKFNEKRELELILDRLLQGEKIALISDAGTPCINDPGLLLVQECIQKKIPFTPIPGPCSLVQALLLSGFDTTRFQAIGFLPKEGLSSVLRSALLYPGTTLALESPSRIEKTLEKIGEIDEERRVAIAREMTKTFEECLRGTPRELLSHFQQKPPRGEMVLIISPNETLPDPLSIEELICMLQEFHGLPLKEAVKVAARLKKIPKREAYKKSISSRRP